MLTLKYYEALIALECLPPENKWLFLGLMNNMTLKRWASLIILLIPE